MNEFLNNLIFAFKPPMQPLEDGAIIVHNDYKLDTSKQPLHFKPELHRHVVSQKIINKGDFIAFVVEYKTDATKLFYNDGSVQAVFNYITAKQPDYGDSTATMPLVLTDDYKRHS